MANNTADSRTTRYVSNERAQFPRRSRHPDLAWVAGQKQAPALLQTRQIGSLKISDLEQFLESRAVKAAGSLLPKEVA